MQHMNRVVFFTSAGFILLFVVLGSWNPTATGEVFEHLLDFIITQLGWFYIISVGFFLLFVLWLLVSPHGKIRLGKDDEEPEFNNFTWFAMLFSAGMGIGLLYFSVAEPVMHFDNPPRAASGSDAVEQMHTLRAEIDGLSADWQQLDDVDEARAVIDSEISAKELEFKQARSQASLAAREAMTTTFFHWGMHAWAIYIIMGLSLAYFSFRHDLPLTIRSSFYPLLGERIHGPIGYTIEILAVVGTLFGVATSLGLGAQQIAAGLEHLGLINLPQAAEGEPDPAPIAEIVIIIVVTLIATISVATGLKVGIRRLSEMNLGLGILLTLFVFIAGPTVFLLSSYVQSVGSYAVSLVELTFRTDAFRGPDWQRSWTMFYWAWWIAWCPFVGMFVARVSRGRTIREFILGALLAPTMLTFLWLVIFGNTALHQEIFGLGGIVEIVRENYAVALFVMLSHLEVAQWLITLFSMIAVIVIATYFVTSSDSASLVIDILTSDGNPDPPLGTRVFWALTEGTVATVLLLAGGLSALQTGAITTALPICLILLAMCWSLFVALRRERHWVETRRLVRRRKRDARLAELLEEFEDASPPEPAVAAAEQLPKTGEATIGVDPEEIDARTEITQSWRSRLRSILQQSSETAGRRPNVDVDRIRSQVNQFLDEIVIPAFKEIREELVQHNREVSIDKQPYQAVLTVRKDGKEEFSYAVRGRAYHKLSFAFPQFDDRDEPRLLRAEVLLPSGPRPEHKTNEFTKDGIIQDFLAEYAKWRGVPLS